MFKRVRAGRLSSNRGFTLVEILIASAIMSIGILGFIEAFKFVTKVSSQMRARSLATNLAQEKIETLKNKSYYMLLLTTSPVTDTRVSPSVSYDDGNYAKESLSVGGLRFERAVRVDFASLAGGSISTMSYTSADPGLKRIVVYVFWYQGSSLKQVSLSNLKENPDVTPLNSSISGTITDGSAAIASMRVVTLQNANFQAYTGSDGKYSFSVTAGSYTVAASKAGYYTKYSALLSVASGADVTQNFTVTTISSGTVISSGVYVSTQILISQVVASTTLPEGNVEYVELFNPTTTSVAIGASDIRLNYYGQTGQGQDEIPISITYRSTYVPSGGYYLIASTGILTTDGVSIDADAVYTSQGASYIRANKAGTIELQNASGTRRIDAVGWSNTSAFSIPQLYEETSGSLCQLGGAPGYVV
ncbi:MAG: carboxypeptidase regulatory-like domain-containing protein, partial [Elusimicrobia bacterium]|nr:carboxypeptidase regulatory-like domain-containing protein [Elusimicrobiota bacterium]